MNSLIEEVFKNFKVDNKAIPVAFLIYTGKDTTYVTYSETEKDNSFSGDDELLGYIDYYDFDIYSKGNYFKVMEKVKQVLKSNGFEWLPSRDSGDMYEADTGYYHKTLCFAYYKEV